MVIGVILILLMVIIVLIVYNFSIQKKIESFKNINQKINSLSILQDFMKIVGEQREYGYDLSKIKPNTYACYIEI